MHVWGKNLLVQAIFYFSEGVKVSYFRGEKL